MMRFIKKVRPLSQYVLEIVFDTEEVYHYDMSSLMNKGVFQRLKTGKNFSEVFVDPLSKTVTWSEGVDLGAERLYEKYLESKK